VLSHKFSLAEKSFEQVIHIYLENIFSFFSILFSAKIKKPFTVWSYRDFWFILSPVAVFILMAFRINERVKK